MASVRFKSFSSGSCGNCYFIGLFSNPELGRRSVCEAGILIDAGVSPRRLKKEMASDGLSYDDLSALLITHDHMDHIRSLGSYCKHVCKPVWATGKLHCAMSRHYVTGELLPRYRRDMSDGWNEIVPGRIRARWFEVPHDASQTLGYAIMLDDFKYVHITDCGRMTDEAVAWCRQADAVTLESNYDPYMLEHGPYPRELQDRIRDGLGHLSNAECASSIASFAHDGLGHIFLCHLSEHNNTPELALAASSSVSGSARLVALPRQVPSPVFHISGD